jgi:hypothetical protein
MAGLFYCCCVESWDSAYSGGFVFIDKVNDQQGRQQVEHWGDA